MSYAVSYMLLTAVLQGRETWPHKTLRSETKTKGETVQIRNCINFTYRKEILLSRSIPHTARADWNPTQKFGFKIKKGHLRDLSKNGP